MFEKILANVKEKTPLVHSITNYVTVNDCANIILACGGSPIMADDIKEVEEITSICHALVINIGTLNERTINSMIKAGKKANEINHPVILDPVGAGASALRTDTVFRLLQKVKFSVIRGNISEVKTVYAGSGSTKGVDADEKDEVNENNIDEVINFAQELALKTGAVIAITGAVDIVADGEKAYIIKNGHPMMSKITGSGCMLTTVIGAYCGANYDHILDSTAAAVCAMGLCGELAFNKVAETKGGTSGFRTYLIDYMSKLDGELLNGGIKIESR
ncbi:MAG: hydroxyethylthiazole kinase [Desulfitobacteriaceae bacterium]|nr:hydroxyethylthiazole kinase [Desulfitobacteriaceae bacterium]